MSNHPSDDPNLENSYGDKKNWHRISSILRLGSVIDLQHFVRMQSLDIRKLSTCHKPESRNDMCEERYGDT